MKKHKLASALDLVDEELIARASPTYLPRRNAIRRKRVLAVVAACLALCLLAGNLWLFLPYGGADGQIREYRDSEYYGLIKKINDYTSPRSKYKNNFDRLCDMAPFFATMDAEGSAPNSAPDSIYQEVTDNQVAGVIEADRIKRTDTHAFYLDGYVLRAFLLAGNESVKVGELELDHRSGDSMRWEFFLSQDGKTATVMAPFWGNGGRQTCVMLVDVSDPAAMAVTKSITVSGAYLSSRLVGEDLLLLTRFSVARSPDFSREETFLPQIDLGNGPRSIKADCIVSPEALTGKDYTVVLLLDGGTLSPKGETALLSYSDHVYVSEAHIAVPRTYSETAEAETGGYEINRTVTELYILSYTDGGLSQMGSVKLAGSVKDQYSMDEHEGILRVVTTLNQTLSRKSNKNAELAEPALGIGTNASLYCIDLATLSVVASKEAFAPEGESVQSVRFDGDVAYVCTAVVLTDPVFFFDLSDLSNITYTETDTIEGYSSSLVQLGDGYLLGIGIGDAWDKMKLEVYEEADGRVVSVAKLVLPDTSFSGVYKSYFIDRENGYIGIGVHTYGVKADATGDASRYVLFRFDKETESLYTVTERPLRGYDEAKRGFVEGEFLYLFGDSDFSVAKIK